MYTSKVLSILQEENFEEPQCPGSIRGTSGEGLSPTDGPADWGPPSTSPGLPSALHTLPETQDVSKKLEKNKILNRLLAKWAAQCHRGRAAAPRRGQGGRRGQGDQRGHGGIWGQPYPWVWGGLFTRHTMSPALISPLGTALRSFS